MSLPTEDGVNSTVGFEMQKKSKFKLIRNIFIVCWSIYINLLYPTGGSASSKYEEYGMFFGAFIVTFFIVFLMSELFILGDKYHTSKSFKIRALIGLTIGMFFTYNASNTIYKEGGRITIEIEKDMKGVVDSLPNLEVNDNGEIIIDQSGAVDAKFLEYINYTMEQQKVTSSKIAEFENIMIPDVYTSTQQLELSVITHDKAIAYLKTISETTRSNIIMKFTELYGVDLLSDNPEFIRSMEQTDRIIAKRIAMYLVSKEHYTYLRGNLEFNENGSYLPEAKKAEYELIYNKYKSSEKEFNNFMQMEFEQKQERLDSLREKHNGLRGTNN